MLREFMIYQTTSQELQRKAEQQRIAKEVMESKKEKWVSRRLRRFGIL